MREKPRQIYTSVRSPDSVARATPRRIVVTLLTLLALATIVIVIVTLV